MDAPREIAPRVSLVPNRDGRRRHIVHALNGRLYPVDHAALDALVTALARAIDVHDVDVVVGFPEGGAIPAYAFARAVGRPVLLASRLLLDVPGAITFEEPHSQVGTTQNLYGLRPGQRVVIIEDELTNGRTALNAVRALRQAGVVIDQIGALMAVDHPALWRRMTDAGITLQVALRLPLHLAPRPLDDEP
jgi:adenine/guanine phosphoribosyltransferase-like PRPP-binding protein